LNARSLFRSTFGAPNSNAPGRGVPRFLDQLGDVEQRL
jgi:hypothetical protein